MSWCSGVLLGWLGHGSSVTLQPFSQRLAGLPNVLVVGRAGSAALLACDAVHQVCGVAGYPVFDFHLLDWLESTPPPYGFLSFTQKIFLQPIPENSRLFPTFECGYPYEIFSRKIILHPLTALLRHLIQKYFFVFCYNQKEIYKT